MLDPQMKRGLLEACVLSALARGDSYGYKIVKDLSVCVQVSESTLYPILRRLESAGALTVYSVEHNSRLRKFYHLTEQGTGGSWLPPWRIGRSWSLCTNLSEEGCGNDQG